MDADESYYIQLYKNYANNHLPETATLAGLWAPDFDQEAYPGLDFIGALRAYLDDLDPYCFVLNKAAQLRQNHYEMFIKNKKVEDQGHRAWREGMNDMALDCSEKSEYWNQIHDRALDEFIDQYEIEEAQKEKRKLKIDISVQNPDEKVKEKTSSRKTIVKRPPLSEAEKERRRREHEEWIKERREMEEKIINEAIKENEIISQKGEKESQQFIKKAESTTRTIVKASLLVEKLYELGFDDVSKSSFFKNKDPNDPNLNFLRNIAPNMENPDDLAKIFDCLLTGLKKLYLVQYIENTEKYSKWVQAISAIFSNLKLKLWGLNYTFDWLAKGNIKIQFDQYTIGSKYPAIWMFMSELIFDVPSPIVWNFYTKRTKINPELSKFILAVHVNGFYTVSFFTIATIIDIPVNLKKAVYTMFPELFFEPEIDKNILEIISIDKRLQRKWRESVEKYKSNFK